MNAIIIKINDEKLLKFILYNYRCAIDVYVKQIFTNITRYLFLK